MLWLLLTPKRCKWHQLFWFPVCCFHCVFLCNGRCLSTGHGGMVFRFSPHKAPSLGVRKRWVPPLQQRNKEIKGRWRKIYKYWNTRHSLNQTIVAQIRAFSFVLYFTYSPVYPTIGERTFKMLLEGLSGVARMEGITSNITV